jgi:mannose-6-phosphate isomerase-like protein (cupin superfamily)
LNQRCADGRPEVRSCRTVEEVGVDVRNAQTVEPEVEHNGTVPVWWLINSREMKEITDGGYLELANEFEVAVGGEVFPHTHPTHEFYFMMVGTGIMTIGNEQREVGPGDLIYIPPDQVHSLRTTSDVAIRSFCFAVGVKGAGVIDYTTH